jgi:hypothetical protein
MRSARGMALKEGEKNPRQPKSDKKRPDPNGAKLRAIVVFYRGGIWIRPLRMFFKKSTNINPTPSKIVRLFLCVAATGKVNKSRIDPLRLPFKIAMAWEYQMPVPQS